MMTRDRILFHFSKGVIYKSIHSQRRSQKNFLGVYHFRRFCIEFGLNFLQLYM